MHNFDRREKWKQTKNESSWRNRTRQHSNIIHKPFDEVFVLVLRITSHSELSLSTDFRRGDLDFQLVFEFALGCRLNSELR